MKNFGGMGGMNMQQMMKQAKEAQAQIERAKEELAETSVEATAGGGMVTIEMSGAYEVVNMKIDKNVVDPDDVEMLEDLIIAATNEAITQVNALRAEKLPM
ncbi:MAG: YbaB/EbfC family nucleoid-associated protein [Firmicutes bacterium]|nr:YbaB/EbfC family nucleoid-associated protein [Bacillota bacterium]